MTRLRQRIHDLRSSGRAALIPYLTAGDPSIQDTLSLADAAARGGADFLELGIPFSDPLADGPVIQRAAARALAAGTKVEQVLDCAEQIRDRSGIGIIFMTYLNPVLAYGWERFAQRAAEVGALGIILTDVPAEEAPPFLQQARELDLGTVFLVTPTSEEHRIRQTCEVTTGFVYCVSRLGITGEREAMSTAFRPVLETVRAISDLPIGLGFGISTPEHARQAAELADAVIVGSALVRVVEKAGSAAARLHDLEAAVRGLRQAVESPRG
ncbi:MAG TPA: tryptophan synthase subunit alpha [bacterium]|nr:tryptophan synthase subunit alpha [bacterium]